MVIRVVIVDLENRTNKLVNAVVTEIIINKIVNIINVVSSILSVICTIR